MRPLHDLDPDLFMSAIVCPESSSTNLHLPHVGPLFPCVRLGLADGHLQVVLVRHGDHVTLVLNLDLEVLPHAELLPDLRDEVGELDRRPDHHVPRVLGVHLDPDPAHVRHGPPLPAAGPAPPVAAGAARHHLKVRLVVARVVLLLGDEVPARRARPARPPGRAPAVHVVQVVVVDRLGIVPRRAAGDGARTPRAARARRRRSPLGGHPRESRRGAPRAAVELGPRAAGQPRRALRLCACEPAGREPHAAVEVARRYVEWPQLLPRPADAHRLGACQHLRVAAAAVGRRRGRDAISVRWRRGREHVAVGPGGLRLLAVAALEVRLDEVAGGVGDARLGPVVLGRFRVVHLLHLGAGEAGECVARAHGGDELGLAEVVLGLQVLDLGLVRAVDDADGYREDGVALAL
jgi:hypothetical protein